MSNTSDGWPEVTALKARVKELEGQVAQLATANTEVGAMNVDLQLQLRKVEERSAAEQKRIQDLEERLGVVKL